MKIVHYLPRIRLVEGGVVRAVIDMTGALADAGEEVTLLTHDPADAPDEWAGADRAPRVVTIPSQGAAGLLPAGARRACEAHIRECDVLHVHTPWERANIQLAKVARRAGKPYALSVHGMLDDWCMAHRGAKKRLYLALAGRRLLENASWVHCTAEAELAQASRWFPRGSGAVVPYVFDIAPFQNLPGPAEARDAFDLPEDRPVILFLSRVHEKKGVEILLRAFAIVRSSRPNAILIVAGPGDDAYVNAMRRLAGDLGLGEDARFPGMVRGERKLSLYQAADVFALPTHQENFGLVLPESLACGTPVVTTRGVDIWAELERSGGARIVDKTPEAVAAAVLDLLADEQALRAAGEGARSWVLEHYDGARTVRSFQERYKAIAGKA
ncbi:MAG: glycosyltransferase [Phycisphaerales bacterium]